MHTPTTHDN